MPVYELINPSDPYTFEAPSIEVAGYCAAMMSQSFGAVNIEDGSEQTPVLFGWGEWFKSRGITPEWVDAHLKEIADCYDSFLIGKPAAREDVKSMLALIPEDKRREWREQRQDRHRSSMSKIGESAYARARAFRKLITEKAK